MSVSSPARVLNSLYQNRSRSDLAEAAIVTTLELLDLIGVSDNANPAQASIDYLRANCTPNQFLTVFAQRLNDASNRAAQGR